MAKDDGTFALAVVAEKAIVFEGRVDLLMVPGMNMPLAILAHHTPMIAKLSEGEVTVRYGKTVETLASITSGVISVGDNSATVLLNL